MSLETGQIVDGKVVAVLPVTDEIISRVEELGQQQKQPFRVSRMLKYEWRPGKPFESDDSTTTEPAQPEMVGPEPVPFELNNAGPNPFLAPASPLQSATPCPGAESTQLPTENGKIQERVNNFVSGSQPGEREPEELGAQGQTEQDENDPDGAVTSSF